MFQIILRCPLTYCKLCFVRYVSAVLPPGSEALRGDEAEAIIKFKNALGIDDPDAASMHMEVFFPGHICCYAQYENAYAPRIGFKFLNSSTFLAS